MVASVSLAVIAGLFFLLTIFLVAVAVKASRAFTETQKLLEMARLQLAPLTHDATEIFTSVRSIVKTAEKEMVKIEDSITAVRDTTRNIKEFETMIQERIERPLLDITAVLSALVKGAQVFFGSMNRRR